MMRRGLDAGMVDRSNVAWQFRVQLEDAPPVVLAETNPRKGGLHRTGRFTQ